MKVIFRVRDVLLVQTETLVRMVIVEMVHDVGHRFVAEAESIEHAIRMGIASDSIPQLCAFGILADGNDDLRRLPLEGKFHGVEIGTPQ
jgi:hypothetical protein